jgi:hypothetical protein
MSIRLLLEEYLSLMKEAGELDVFLPVLLTAMGHDVVFKAQSGVRQYGVDIVTRGPGEKGEKRLFLWIVKCGDIGRRTWAVGNQSIRNSIQEVGDVYLETHVSPQDAKLPATMVVLTNGAIQQEVALEMTTYFKKWVRQNRVKAEAVVGSTLATWTEKYLLNEYALPAAHRSLFRKALATVETSEVSYQHSRELVVGLMSAAQLSGRSARARRKKLLSALRAVATFNTVLHLWARDARNLATPYLVAEFSVLHTWSRLHDSPLLEDAAVGSDLHRLVSHYLGVCEFYHREIDPYYRVQSAIATRSNESAIIAVKVFDEMGRLGLAACTLFLIEREIIYSPMRQHASQFVDRIEALLKTHSVSGSPCFDGHSTDISLAILALVADGRIEVATNWLNTLIDRLGFAKRSKKYAPIQTDSFEDLIAIRHDSVEHVDEFTKISTLVPVFGLWCCVLDAKEGFALLSKVVAPLFAGATFNLWSPDAKYEAILSDEVALRASGFAECFLTMPETADQLTALLEPRLREVPEIEGFKFSKHRWHWIPLMVARHTRTQIPHRAISRLCNHLQERNRDVIESPRAQAGK